MEVQLDSVEEPVDRVLRGRRQARAFSLHDRSELSHNLPLVVEREKGKGLLSGNLFVLAEDLGGQPRGEDVVDVLEETFLFDVLVGEQESCLVAVHPTVPEENLFNDTL